MHACLDGRTNAYTLTNDLFRRQIFTLASDYYGVCGGDFIKGMNTIYNIKAQ